MKKHALIFLIIGLSLLCLNALSDTIWLNQAVLDKKLTVQINGADKSLNTTSYTPSYTGLCIQLAIENLTNKDIKVFLDAGRFLEPEDTAVQRMMITQNQMIAVEKKSKKKIKSYAMCSQMLDASPGATTVFLLGKKAEGSLLELAQLISKNNYQSNAAQCAVWALTDNDDVYNIYSDNAAEMKTLRNFVKKVKGITDTTVDASEAFNLNKEAMGTYLNYGKAKLNGSFEFELKEETQLNLALYDMNDKLTIQSLTNYSFHSGTNTVKYEFVYKNIPLGNYHLKLTDNTGVLFIDKILTFK